MKSSNLGLLISVSLIIMGCIDGNTVEKTSSNIAESRLDGGFRAGEILKVYSTINSMQRSGRVEHTGDYYNYGSTPRSIEIVSVEVPFSTDSDVILAAKRVKIIGGCHKDRVTDITTCRMNVFPQGNRHGGGLSQTVSASGSILSSCIIGHNFPGRIGAIRVDSNLVIMTNRKGCISGATANILEKQLKNGRTLITRRVEWPYNYSQDKEMLIEGSFSVAQELYRWSASANLPALFSQGERSEHQPPLASRPSAR